MNATWFLAYPHWRCNNPLKWTRVIIEQTFGRWNLRFQDETDKVCSIIVFCEVLHGTAIQWKQPLLEDEVSNDSYGCY